MSGQTWTPAPKKGIIPLHPMTFGMLLTRSFAALRHNPKVLFGFGVVIQLAVVVLSATVMGFVFVTTFTRLESLSAASPDFEAVFAGTIAMNIVAGIAVGLASIAFTALMQGVVAAEIGFAAIGVKATLGTLWRKMIPSFWRLAGFASLSIIFVFGIIVIVFLVIAGFIAGGLGGSAEAIGGIVILVVLLVLATIPLVVWLTTKLLLVPSILVLEKAKFRDALVRSWRLTRGRFWVAWGVTFLIGAIMGVAMQVVNLPVSLIGSMLGSVIAPTGSADTASIMAFVFALLAPQILLLVLQAITLVVQSSAGTLVYLDSRMRYEGLDQALISHVERRDLGWTDEQLGDPFIVDAERAVSSAPPPKQVPEWAMMTPTGYEMQPYPGQQYGGQPYPAQQYPAQPYGAPQYPAPPQYPGQYPAAPPYQGQPYQGQPSAAPQYPAQQAPPLPPYAQQPAAAQPPAAPQPPATFAPPPAYSPPASPPAESADSTWAAPGTGGEGSA
ncbi:glycerophosphoryl diester phosphodiesterase membrane domain-containing protein [Microbacterium phyllosphaerae]|uniref:glycerophosphoryl diester phosphodiesterase membrane domain-containing protein n=1 Tax=Microbacterium phyllosphaerae TaxID=124798 RepID=UPI003D651AA7